MTVATAPGRSSGAASALALPPRRQWWAITMATLVVVPAYWAILAGQVSLTLDDGEGVANPGAAIAFGLAVIPFAFIVLALLSEHPQASPAVVKAMGAAVLVGVPVSAVAADAVTGVVAAIGAGGVFALRPERVSGLRPRVLAVLLVCVYTAALAQASAALALLPAPFFPFTALGLADHLAARRQERTPAGP